MKRLLLILLLAAAGVRIGLASILPLTDPTEGRYAQIAREMVATGDWVTPRLWINGEQVPFLGKPPLFFWVAASSIKILGTNEFAVRLPSFIAGAALLILMFFVLSKYIGRQTAISATLITATSAIFFFLFGSVAIDMLLALFVAGALLIYLAFFLEAEPKKQGRWSLVFFVFLAGGFLTKGPVALVLIGLPIVIWTGLNKKWSLVGRHSWTLGVALFAAIVTPWFVLIELRNPGFLQYFFINENLLRYLSHDYGDIYGTSHQLPRGSAILLFLLAALPWSIVAALQVLKTGWRGFREMMRDDVQSFLFIGFGASVIFWAFSQSPLITYMVPAVPLLASWIAVQIGKDERSPQTTSLALASLTICCALLVATTPLASGDSARQVLREAERAAKEMGVSDRVIFAHRTPPSAFFYAHDRVIDHRQEFTRASIRKLLETGDRRLLIIRQEYIDEAPLSQIGEIPPRLFEHLEIVWRSDDWNLYVTPAQSTTLRRK